MIIDTHIHLYDDRYKDDFSKVIQNAINNDVRKLIVVGYDYESSLMAIDLANQYEFMYASIGLHPTEVQKELDHDLRWVDNLAKKPKVIAIGEIGLDYYWDKSFLDLQKYYFMKQIQIANQNKLPIIIHSRSASLDTFTILKDNPIKGVLHCYSSSLEMAREYVKLGYYLGIGGVVTFKNSKEIKEVVKEIDLEHLLSETDGPYLSPSPFRGKRNEPSYLIYIIEEISKLKNIEIEKVKNKIEENTFKLFKI